MSEMYKKIAAVARNLPALTRDTPGYNYRYANLSQVLDALAPGLAAQKITVLQPVTGLYGVCVSTVVVDNETGERETVSELQLPELDDMQKLGSAITYARRYALVSLFNMDTVDDDGEAASRNRFAQHDESNFDQPAADDPLARVFAAYDQAGDSADQYKEMMKERYGSWSSLTDAEQRDAADWLENLVAMGGKFEEEK